MKQLDTLASPNYVSCFGVIKNTCHVEFSDMGMLTPLWLSRLTGMCNKNRNTHDTAKEIGKTTLRFLAEASRKFKKVQESSVLLRHQIEKHQDDETPPDFSMKILKTYQNNALVLPSKRI